MSGTFREQVRPESAGTCAVLLVMVYNDWRRYQQHAWPGQV